MKAHARIRREIAHAGKLMYQRGYVAATDGNLSVRLDQNSILITPTNVSKGMMRPTDLVVIDMYGNKLAGQRNVSSETAMHLQIYKLRPEIFAVVHAHPPFATGYAAAGISLDPALVCEAAIGLGAVPLAPYATPGTPQLAAAIAPLVPEHEAILLANHGVVTYGEDLLCAYQKMELVEHFAMIALVTELLGHRQLLRLEELEKLGTTRKKQLHKAL